MDEEEKRNALDALDVYGTALGGGNVLRTVWCL